MVWPDITPADEPPPEPEQQIINDLKALVDALNVVSFALMFFPGAALAAQLIKDGILAISALLGVINILKGMGVPHDQAVAAVTSRLREGESDKWITSAAQKIFTENTK